MRNYINKLFLIITFCLFEFCTAFGQRGIREVHLDMDYLCHCSMDSFNHKLYNYKNENLAYRKYHENLRTITVYSKGNQIWGTCYWIILKGLNEKDVWIRLASIDVIRRDTTNKQYYIEQFESILTTVGINWEYRKE